MTDPYDLERFLLAQDADYSRALNELLEGRKRSHWMWYVFPQIDGLGSSPMARRYAITNRAEAAAYLGHPILGARLRECAAALLVHRGRTAREMLGTPDDLKLRSSATLFAEVEGDGVFARLLDQFFHGAPDERTLALMHAAEKRT